ncbi:MAG: hypothetical protein ACK40O_01400 [Allosphingosinicella sp.]
MHLLRRIERHLRRRGMAPSTFGRKATGDPRLVRDLRRGREAGPDLAARLHAWMDAEEARAGAKKCSRR